MYLKWVRNSEDAFAPTTVIEKINTLEFIRDIHGVAIVLNGRELNRVGNEYPSKRGQLLTLFNAVERRMNEGKNVIDYESLKSERGL